MPVSIFMSTSHNHKCSAYTSLEFIKSWDAYISLTTFRRSQLEWPAHGSDVNPTEHFWDELEGQLPPGLLAHYQ